MHITGVLKLVFPLLLLLRWVPSTTGETVRRPFPHVPVALSGQQSAPRPSLGTAPASRRSLPPTGGELHLPNPRLRVTLSPFFPCRGSTQSSVRSPAGLAVTRCPQGEGLPRTLARPEEGGAPRPPAAPSVGRGRGPGGVSQPAPPLPASGSEPRLGARTPVELAVRCGHVGAAALGPACPPPASPSHPAAPGLRLAPARGSRQRRPGPHAARGPRRLAAPDCPLQAAAAGAAAAAALPGSGGGEGAGRRRRAPGSGCFSGSSGAARTAWRPER